MRRSFFDLTENDTERLAETVRDFVETPVLRRWVTYTSKGTRTFSASAGTISSSDSVVGLWAARTALTLERREVFETADFTYFVLGSELYTRGVEPKTDGFLTDDSKVFEVVDVVRPVARIWYELIVKGR